MEKSKRKAKKLEIPLLQEKGGGKELNIDINGMAGLDDIQVSNFESNVENLKQYFRQQVNCFKAGRISDSYSNWLKLTSDSEILNTVEGQIIEFAKTLINIGYRPGKKFQPR